MTENNNQQQHQQTYQPHQWPDPAPQYAPPTTYGVPQPPLPQRPKGKKKKAWILPVALFVGGLIVGGSSAASAKSEPAAAEPTPAPTVTKTVTEKPEPAPTVTKTVNQTPAACIEALDLADQGFSIGADAMGFAGDALQGAANFDVDAVTTANEGMTGENDKMRALTPRYQAAKAACRDAG